MKTQTATMTMTFGNQVIDEHALEPATMGIDFWEKPAKTFSAADAWNILRRKRTRTHRRFMGINGFEN